jgi:hypothetical protein
MSIVNSEKDSLESVTNVKSLEEFNVNPKEVERQKLLDTTTKHVGFAIGGLGISVMYLVLCSVYHFFKPGFGFSIFGLISSVIYYFFSWRSLKFQRRIAES